MGTVFRATDPDLHRQVAVKVMREDPSLTVDAREDARRRFLQEARAAAALAHPNVATIYRIGEEDGRPYIAMEWLEGETLEDALKRRVRLTVAEVARVGWELFDALEAAHACGVVHRDIKPGNLMLLTDGRLKVTDFGIAQLRDSTLVRTRAGEILATPLYASPEQLLGQAVDGRSDLFSAGVVLYQCLAGRPPFDGHTLAELSTAVLHVEPPPPHTVNPAVPVGLSTAVMRLLKKSRDARYAHARDAAEALRPYVERLGGRGQQRATTPLRLFTPRKANAPSDDPFPVTPVPIPEGPPVLAGLPPDPRGAVASVVLDWPAKDLGRRHISELVSKLLEMPLHTEAYSGGLLIGESALLLLHRGWIVTAIDLRGERTGDEVAESLPADAEARLHPLPRGSAPGLVPLLASLLLPRRVRHADLDSSFVNLAALGKRLADEAFDGLLFLHHQGDNGVVLFDHGRTALSLFSGAWEAAALHMPWDTWVSDLVVTASVEERAFAPLMVSFRTLLRNTAVNVEEGAKSSTTNPLRRTGLFHRTPPILTGIDATRRLSPRIAADGPGGEGLSQSVSWRFLSWALNQLPKILAERGKTETLKYVAQWLPLVRSALLHHELPHPNDRDSDFFDVVTEDADGKVLHMAHRVPRGTPEALAEFVERVKRAKTARIKRGDVGGAFLISPTFEEKMLEAYVVATTPEAEPGGWKFGAIEAMTSYEGFVRIGPRRGFHLLLVRETAGGFELVAP